MSEPTTYTELGDEMIDFVCKNCGEEASANAGLSRSMQIYWANQCSDRSKCYHDWTEKND